MPLGWNVARLTVAGLLAWAACWAAVPWDRLRPMAGAVYVVAALWLAARRRL